MSLVSAFVLFMVSMVACLLFKQSILIAMFVGLIAFLASGKKKGFAYSDLKGMAIGGIRESLIVIEIMFLIGLITAVWRSAGTITYFVYYGISIITPSLFILTAFLLCCVLSYILGTSFGVAGTLGVIIMALARSGGVNELIIAGAIISGVYFGDRNSPVSSSAILVASVTKTNIYDNVKMMFKTSAIGLVIITGIYGVLSVMNPLQTVDKSILTALESDFVISPWTILPALFMLILPLLKINIVWVFISSIVSGFLITLFVQKMPLMELLRCCVTGYQSTGALGTILNGGGIVSMLTVCGVILLSATYSGIFQGTNMLSVLQEQITKLSIKFGRYPTMLGTSTLVTCIFCNQTIATMMSRDLLEKPYEEGGASNTELAMDIENSSIILCALVPWAVSCTVPIQMLGTNYGALIYAFLPYGIPVSYFFTKKLFFVDANKGKI